MDTNEIVTELYALRAGLSLIAQETDKFDAEIAVADEQKKAAISSARATADNLIRQSNDNLSQAQRSFQNAQIILADAKMAVEKAQDKYEGNQKIINDNRYTANHLKDYRRNMPIKSTFGILSCIFYTTTIILLPFLVYLHLSPFIFIPMITLTFAIGIMEFIMAFKEYDLDEIWYGIAYIINVISIGALMIMVFYDYEPWHFFHIISFILSIISTIICFILTAKQTKAYRLSDKDMIKYNEDKLPILYDAQKNLEQSKIDVEDAKNRYQQLLNDNSETDNALTNTRRKNRDAIENAERDYDKQRKKAESQYQEFYDASAALHGKISSEIWDMLVKAYGDLLDFRDWGILDLVIWQLETGRADTIKEALQLADRETQTDRIVQTMRSASEAIAQRIDSGFGNLQSQLSSSFYTLAMGLTRATSELSYQIKSSSNKIADRIDASSQATAQLYESQTENLLATNRNLEQLFSQSSLQTALLEKSNSSSKELIAAVNKLRKA